MLTDTAAARQEGYVFVDSSTGQTLCSFLLDNDHGALLTPDGGELLMAGADGSVRTLARYDPATLELRARVGINLGDTLANTVGIGGQFEPSPDGGFIFSGTDAPNAVNFIGKYDVEFNRRWETSFTYNGSYALTGVESYPLPNGDVGMYVFFNQLAPGTGGVEVVDVFGLLDGETGDLKWTFSYRPPLGKLGNRLENFRFTFGSDGSFFAHAAAQLDISDITAPADFSVAKVVRVTPEGEVGYSKTVTVADAVVVGEHYMDGYAMLHYSFEDEENTQFVVLDRNGNLTGNTAVGNHLSAGDGDLTATRRSGTDIAFIRASYSPGGETLARLDLSNGDMEFRQLPLPFPGNAVYEAVGASGAYPVAPFNTPGGLSSVSRVLGAEILNPLGSDFRMELIELPVSGGFPPCIPYADATIAFITPQPTSVADVEFIDLEDGWTASASGRMPGLTASDVAPELLPMPVMAEIVCEDDGSGVGGIAVAIQRSGPERVELSFETTAGAAYSIQGLSVLGDASAFEDVQTVVGDGQPYSWEIPLDGVAKYFRVMTE